MTKSTKQDGPSCGRIFKILSFIYKHIKQLFRKSKNQTLGNIKVMIEHCQDLDSRAKAILINGLRFVEKDVEDVMIARSDIFAISSKATAQQINKALLETSHTRILVYEETLDNIIGFIHVKDIYKSLATGKSAALAQIIRTPITVVPSTKLINLLSLMQQQRTHIADVADEYGGIVGMVTNEDVVEALVGDINDEHDDRKVSKSAQYHLVDPQTLIASARIKIEKAQELLQIDLSQYQDSCATIGGVVIEKAGTLPTVGSIITINDNIEVEILEANKRVLKKIKIKVN